MDKKGFITSKTIIYILGGATIGYIFGQNTFSMLIGGLVGLAVSFLK
jgi:hypothetical protein